MRTAVVDVGCTAGWKRKSPGETDGWETLIHTLSSAQSILDEAGLCHILSGPECFRASQPGIMTSARRRTEGQ
jgi:hypothetical protein